MGSAVNFDKLCRICTVELPDGVLIFSEIGKKLCLEAKLKKYLHISVSSDDNLPKVLCMNCCKKLDSIHKFASMAVKMQDKLRLLLETGATGDIREHSILHSILSKGSETECEVTELEVRVDPMLFLCAFEDGSSDGEDLLNCDDSSLSPTDPSIKIEESSCTAPPPSSPTPSSPASPPCGVVAASPTSLVSSPNSPRTPDSLSPRQNSSPPPALPPSSASEKETKPYRCSVCARSFFNEIGLQNHLWSHLPADSRRVLGAAANGLPQRVAPVYSSRGVLHTNTAAAAAAAAAAVAGVGGLRFACPICGKKISTKGNLKVHLETHRPKGKYGCDICGRVFKTQSNLCRHKDYHGGVQFPCGVCGRVYPTNSTLRAHSITHSDLRPHACPLCDKTFKRNQDLKFHINQHTGARPYQCPYCPKAFASSGNCFSHRKRMHPQEVERDRERAAQLMR